MLLEYPQDSVESIDGIDRPRIAGNLPSSFTFTELAAGRLRAFLNERRLENWHIFAGDGLDLTDIDYHLQAVGDAGAVWTAAGPLISGGESIGAMEKGSAGYWLAESGFLHLKNREVVIARWSWVDTNDDTKMKLHLAAAASTAALAELRQRMRKHRRSWSANVWQFVTGYAYHDGPRVPRTPVEANALFLPQPLRERIEVDVASFFSEPVAALYRSLQVPYRRGVLLHGLPGNGKTSLIRLLGAQLPTVPFMVLRPNNSFDADDFSEIIRRWKNLAPAVLVVEDLNWLLSIVNISMFLNLLDGIDTGSGYSDSHGEKSAEGLMLIATTNDPAALDPAINNRPGRFDVVIEISSPNEQLRAQFLQAKLPELDSGTIDQIVSRSSGFSFAHLQELLRLSGLLALAGGRAKRSMQDLLKAVDELRETQRAAQRGFPAALEVPFGLQHMRRNARS